MVPDTYPEVTRSAEQPPWSALLESLRDGLAVVDAGWRVTYLNASAEVLLRLSRERALGAWLWSLVDPEATHIAESLRASMQDGLERHLREVRPEGRGFHGRVFDVWIYPQPGGGLALLIRDVRERVQRETELARLAAEAEEATRAKSRFFAAVSHELRTPLNAIVGYTHLLRSDSYGEMPEGARRAADRASICAEHLANLVDDVLLLTTAEIDRLPVVPVPLALADFLRDAAQPLRMQAEAKGLRFEMEIDRALPPVETDPARLRQLLWALVSNAVKFTSQGAVRLRARAWDAADGASPEWSLFPDDGVEIAVIDTGPGIAPEDRERIFAPFEQLGDPARPDSFTRGTGLGLTIARQLARLLRGELRVNANPEGGSVFALRLPRSFSG